PPVADVWSRWRGKRAPSPLRPTDAQCRTGPISRWSGYRWYAALNLASADSIVRAERSQIDGARAGCQRLRVWRRGAPWPGDLNALSTEASGVRRALPSVHVGGAPTPAAAPRRR